MQKVRAFAKPRSRQVTDNQGRTIKFALVLSADHITGEASMLEWRRNRHGQARRDADEVGWMAKSTEYAPLGFWDSRQTWISI